MDWTCYDNAGRVARTVTNASGDGGTPQTDPCDAENYQPGLDPDKDRINETRYDIRGNAIAAIEWVVTSGGAISYTTRTYYDDASRPITVVQNLTGWPIGNPAPPDYDPGHPDQNVRSETVYDDNGNVLKTIDNAGRVTYYCYDALNRVVLIVYNPTIGNPCYPYTHDPDPDKDVAYRTVYDANGNVIATIDPLGRITRTYYDALDRPVIVVENFVSGSIYDPPPAWNEDYPDQNVRADTVYDENGNVVKTIDNTGIETYYCYDEVNRMVKTVYNPSQIGTADPCASNYGPSTDPEEDVIHETVYDANGNAIATIDPLGIVTRSYYDELNRPYLVVRNVPTSYIYNDDPPACNRGNGDEYVCTETIYDEETGEVIATIDPLGRITRTYYDELGRPVTVVRNLTGHSYELDYPPSTFGNEENVAIETVYDEYGYAIAAIEWLMTVESTPVSITTRTYYDALGRPVTTIRNFTSDEGLYGPMPDYDPAYPDRNVRSDSAYDAAGNAIATIEWFDDEYGLVISRTTRTYYDELNRPITVVQNLDPEWCIYTPFPPECNRDDELSNEPYNVCVETVYGKNGNAIAMNDPLDRITRTYYDGLDRVVTVVKNLSGQGIGDPPPARNPDTPDENVRTDTSYDAAGNRSAQTDPNGVVTAYECDAVNRLTAVIENSMITDTQTVTINVRTEYTYDRNGNLVRIRDANSVLGDTDETSSYYTKFTYDDLNRLVSETDPLDHIWSYDYDVAGNRVSMTDAEERQTDFAYDGLNRLEGIDYQSDPDVTFEYNALGWRTTMEDGLGKTTWVYDDLGRPLAITTPITDTVRYTYDALGNRTGLSYPDGKTVAYAYDPLSRLIKVTDWDNLVTMYAYDVAGNLIETHRPNDIDSTWHYDDLNRVISIVNTTSGGTLSFFEYTYDPAGNRTSLTERVRHPGEPLDLIFEDGFESGDFSAWSAHTDKEDLSVTTTAAITGTYGMLVSVNDTERLYVTDNTPEGEKRYRVRFYLDPNSIAVTKAHQIFQGQMEVDSVWTTVVKIHFRKTNNVYYVDAFIRRDNNTWTSITAQILNGANAIEIDWQASSGPGQNNGRLTLWVNDNQVGQRTGIDNDTHHIDRVKMGTIGDPGSSQGAYCFDAFESRSQSYIGLASGAHGCGSGWETMQMQGGPEGMLPLVPMTGTVPLTGVVPITGSVVVLTVTLPVTSSIVITTGQIAVVTTTVDITITGVISPTIPITIPGGYRSNKVLASLVHSILKSLPKAYLLEERRTSVVITIEYEYDPLYRLTSAEYSDGTYFHYTHDAVGNRLTWETTGGVITYTYDIANRLTSVDGEDYTWDDNGNLLNDGEYVYTYDQANRLTHIAPVAGVGWADYEYNGLGDRMRETMYDGTTEYALDLASGLTQVLADDNENRYLYGVGRIGEEGADGWQYHHGDALGSVRILTAENGSITLAKDYKPFGDTLASEGDGSTVFAFTGEMRDDSGLTYLRARYLDTGVGRFITRDTWGGDSYEPMSYNAWLYALANPLRYTDPSGLITQDESASADNIVDYLTRFYNVKIVKDWGWRYVVPAIPNPFYMCPTYWEEGNWRSVHELEVTRKAFDVIVTVMGGDDKFKSAMRERPVTVVRFRSIPGAWGMAPPYLGLILLTDGLFDQSDRGAKFSIAHEVGHIWDWRQWGTLSLGLSIYIGTTVCDNEGHCWFDLHAGKEEPPGLRGAPAAGRGFNPLWEDWAESFAYYVYRSHYKYYPGYLELGPLRRQYIKEQIQSIR